MVGLDGAGKTTMCLALMERGGGCNRRPTREWCGGSAHKVCIDPVYEILDILTKQRGRRAAVAHPACSCKLESTMSVLYALGARAPLPTGMTDIYAGQENRMARGRMNEWIYYSKGNAVERMRIFDLGGAEEYRNRCWAWGGRTEPRYKEVKGLVFVVDARDKERFPEAKRVLQTHVLSHVNSAQIPVLILANVKDTDKDTLVPYTPAERREIEQDVKVGLGIVPGHGGGDARCFTPCSELYQPPPDKLIFQLCVEPLWTKSLEDGFLELRRNIVDNIKILQGCEERQVMLR
eukprot:gene18769-67318_t